MPDTPRPADVPDEVMRAFVNGASSSPPDVKANSPEWVRNGLVRALAAHEAAAVAETAALQQRAEQAEEMLREEITAMAEERRFTGRASILNVIRERDEQRARAERAEVALTDRDTEIERQVRERVAAEQRAAAQAIEDSRGENPDPLAEEIWQTCERDPQAPAVRDDPRTIAGIAYRHIAHRIERGGA